MITTQKISKGKNALCNLSIVNFKHLPIKIHAATSAKRVAPIRVATPTVATVYTITTAI